MLIVIIEAIFLLPVCAIVPEEVTPSWGNMTAKFASKKCFAVATRCLAVVEEQRGMKFEVRKVDKSM